MPRAARPRRTQERIQAKLSHYPTPLNFDAGGGTTYRHFMSDGSNDLDPDRPGAVRLSVSEAQALGEAALARI